MQKEFRDRLINVLLILLILLALLYLIQMLAQFLSGYADIILLFLLGWLVSFVLNPMVFLLSAHPFPTALEPLLKSIVGEARARAFLGFRFSREAGVIIVYLGLVLVIVIATAMFAPTVITQLTTLASRLPEYMAQAPELSAWAQTRLAQFGIRVNVNQAVQSGLASLQTYAASIIQNALVIFTGIMGLLANLFFVLIIGFILTMDGPRLRRALLSRIPKNYHDEALFFSSSVDRTFGGFLRGQLFQALLVAIGTAIVMTLFGLNYILVASLFVALFMVIPLVGPFLALIPPLLATLFQAPDLTLWIVLILFVYQFVIVNVLMPRLIGNSVGLHPLLVFAAILVSVRVAGFWGAFFGIPVVGVVWAMGVFFFERWQREYLASETEGQKELD